MTIEEKAARIQFANSHVEFTKLALYAESGAGRVGFRTLDQVAQPVYVVFEDAETVEKLAYQRFGTGSPSTRGYVEEHLARKRLFRQGINDGKLRCREIYSRTELLQYAKSRRRGTVVLEKRHILSTLMNWCNMLRDDPECYQARMTDQQLPIKYSLGNDCVTIIDQSRMIEKTGRLTAFALIGESSAAHFRKDFETAWARAQPETPDNAAAMHWIEEALLPALEAG